jgi:hypothetical protein
MFYLYFDRPSLSVIILECTDVVHIQTQNAPEEKVISQGGPLRETYYRAGVYFAI